jgi:hypothetical protein
MARFSPPDVLRDCAAWSSPHRAEGPVPDYISIIRDSWRDNENDLPRYNRFEDQSHSAAAFDTPFIGHQNTYGVAGDSKVLPGAKFISVSDGSADVCAPGVKLKSEES